MFYLIYVSSATVIMSEDKLLQLLEDAQKNNTEKNITGMLLYKGGNFMQILEGEKNTVLDLFDAIKQDIRHKDALTILTGEIAQRNFDNWSMGFCNMDKCLDYPDYDTYINESLLSRRFQDESQEAYRFMISFNEWMRE